MKRGAIVAVAMLLTVGGCSGGGGNGNGNTNTNDNGSTGVPYSNPPEIVSQDGTLATTITMQAAVQTVAGEDVTFPALYNGLYTPPTLRVQQGDTIQLTFRNFGVEPTNLHYHGLAVTPQDNGDNVFLSFDPGESHAYDFPIPANHASGLFWYHPHLDPYLNTQLGSGAAGALVIGDILKPFPELAGIPERIMMLKDLKTVDGVPRPDPDPAGPTTRTINGIYQPDITMRPGQLEFWRIGDFSSNIFYQLSIPGVQFHVIAEDGNLQNRVVTTDTLILPPGKRYEVLVYGPPAGTYTFQTADFKEGVAHFLEKRAVCFTGR